MYYAHATLIICVFILFSENFGKIKLKETEWKCTQTTIVNPNKIDNVECIEYKKIKNGK